MCLRPRPNGGARQTERGGAPKEVPKKDIVKLLWLAAGSFVQ
jgi:hypothetical protein